MTGEHVAALILQHPTPLPHAGLAVRVLYVCGHEKRALIPTHPHGAQYIPDWLLRCECGGRWRWIGEDVE